MPLVTHLFESHKRFEHGVEKSFDRVQRRANCDYDMTGSTVVISIMSTLSSQKAYLVRQDGFTLYYEGEDPDYLFELECWPDNGTIRRFSVFRVDTGVEIMYLSSRQDAM